MLLHFNFNVKLNYPQCDFDLIRCPLPDLSDTIRNGRAIGRMRHKEEQMAVLQRTQGRRTLLEQIRQSGPIPRIELSDKTGISRATVTTITAELLQHGLIEEVTPEAPDPEHRRGRPRVDLRIRGGARLVAGGKIAHQKLSLVLLDFQGRRLGTLETDLGAPRQDPVALATDLARAVDRLAREAGQSPGGIAGVGLGIPGMVEAETGMVHWSPSLSDRNIGFGRTLTQTLGVPAFIDNDANLVALAERRFGLARDRSDFLVVTIESGVGLGLMIGGELYRGTRGCGAEFGHTKVHLDGALCRCGQRGCLEAYVADYALLREAATLDTVPAEADTGTRVQALLSAAKRGDANARTILHRAGRMFAMGLANLVNLFDPELIILAGEHVQFDHLFADEISAEMRKSIVQVDKPAPKVVVHRWDDLMWARGAAAFALDQVSELALAELSPT